MGFANDPSIFYLIEIIFTIKLCMCAIFEPRILVSWVRGLRFFAGTIGCFSNQDIVVKCGLYGIMQRQFALSSCRTKGSQWRYKSIRFYFFATTVYARCIVQARKALWRDLLELILLTPRSWNWGGDFNTVQRLDERIGGRTLMLNSLEEFNDCMHICGMNDVPTSGREGSSWLRHSCIRQILDHVLQLPVAFQIGGFSAKIIQKECSDHALLLLSLSSDHYSGPRCWNYLGVWCHGAGMMM